MLTITSTFLLKQQQCEQRGCCWNPLDERNVPWCFFPVNHGYTAESVNKPRANGKCPSLCSALPHWWKYVAFYLAHIPIVTAPHSPDLSVCPPHIIFFPFHLLCLRHGFLWNMTWMAYQKTWLTLQLAGFSIFCLISLPFINSVIHRKELLDI